MQGFYEGDVHVVLKEKKVISTQQNFFHADNPQLQLEMGLSFDLPWRHGLPRIDQNSRLGSRNKKNGATAVSQKTNGSMLIDEEGAKN